MPTTGVIKMQRYLLETADELLKFVDSIPLFSICNEAGRTANIGISYQFAEHILISGGYIIENNEHGSPIVRRGPGLMENSVEN